MKFRALVLALPTAWLLLFLGAPLAVIVLIALATQTDSVPPYVLGSSLDNLITVATDPIYRQALVRSLETAWVSTLACLLAGFPMALGIARTSPKWQNLLLLATMLPFWTGFLMRINAWIGLLRDDGLIVHGLQSLGFRTPQLLYTDIALYIGVVYTYLPFMVLPLYARLSRLDPALMEAAADLGEPPLRVFMRVTLPLSLPGIAAGAALVFIPVIGEYVIPTLLGGAQAPLIGNVLGDEFFTIHDWPTAAAVAVWLLGLLLLVPALGMWLVRRLR
jgi:putrescine transport system permease protein